MLPSKLEWAQRRSKGCNWRIQRDFPKWFSQCREKDALSWSKMVLNQVLRDLLFKLAKHDFLEVISKSKVYSMMLNCVVNLLYSDWRQKWDQVFSEFSKGRHQGIPKPLQNDNLWTKSKISDRNRWNFQEILRSKSVLSRAVKRKVLIFLNLRTILCKIVL